MLLACTLHALQLAVIEFMLVDVSPIVRRCIHGEAWSDGAVGADDDVVLPGAAVPLGEMQFAALVLHDAGRVFQLFCNVSIRSRSVAIPAEAL